ncbi:hypothetical protein PG989_006563 [Apiospora arundinis]|uniref:C6 transcription factor n=1 Tax=Apiospora arundinis TaxID=335852 RepID=A0ABR2I7B4_9PEZI
MSDDPTPSEPKGTVRLRDSCQACAASKVKCSKDKPTCSRCESRYMPCQYFAIKRPGRRRDNTRANSTNSTNSNKNKNNSSAAQGTSPKADGDGNRGDHGDVVMVAPASLATTLPSSKPLGTSLVLDSGSSLFTNLTPTSPQTSNSIVVESMGEPFAMGDAVMSPDLVDFGTELTDLDFFMSVMDTTYCLPTHESPTISTPRKDIASMLIPGKSAQPGLMTEPLSAMHRMGSLSPSPVSSNGQISAGPSSNSTSSCLSEEGSCLTQALGFLKQLSAPQTPPSSSGGATTPQGTLSALAQTMPHPHGKSQEAWVQSVLVESKRIIEVLSGTLACECASDGFLLNIVCMTVLKLLARYAVVVEWCPSAGGYSLATAAAGDAHLEKPFTARLARGLSSNIMYEAKRVAEVVGYEGTRGEDDAGRMRAQRVLGELHPVQRLINDLSPKLKYASEEARRSEGMVTPSISVSVLQQLEVDLRQSLSQLSASVIHRLRHY